MSLLTTIFLLSLCAAIFYFLVVSLMGADRSDQLMDDLDRLSSSIRELQEFNEELLHDRSESNRRRQRLLCLAEDWISEAATRKHEKTRRFETLVSCARGLIAAVEPGDDPAVGVAQPIGGVGDPSLVFLDGDLTLVWEMPSLGVCDQCGTVPTPTAYHDGEAWCLFAVCDCEAEEVHIDWPFRSVQATAEALSSLGFVVRQEVCK